MVSEGMKNSPSCPSLSLLPDDIIVNILARIPKSQYRSLSLVSKSFHSLLSSPELYAARSQTGNIEPRLYVCLQVPKTETTHHRWFTITNFDKTLMSNKKGPKLSLKRVKHCGRDRLNSTSVAVGNEIYQMGGSKKNMLSRFVYVVDCRSHKRRRAPKMTVPRKRAKSCFLDGKIYVVGGCKKTEETMNWGEVFDLTTQIWKPFPSPTDNLFDDQDHKFLVFSEKLYIMTEDNNYI